MTQYTPKQNTEANNVHISEAILYYTHMRWMSYEAQRQIEMILLLISNIFMYIGGPFY